MFCPKCGTPTDDYAVQCSRCGQAFEVAAPPPQGFAAPPQIPTRLVPAILVTLFCCLPFGIVSIVYAAQVSAKVATGDYRGAMEASGKAGFWCWMAFGFGLAATIIWFVFGALAGYSGVAAEL